MTRRVWIPVLLLCLSLPLAAQRGPRLVFVRVVDSVGAPVRDLTVKDFDLLENGTRRQVTRVGSGSTPMRIVLLIDSSSAMAAHLTSFRAGLSGFLETLPGDHEIGLITTGGQLRPRVPPTAERQKLAAAAASFAQDGGANAFLDSLLEADRRFLKNAGGKWPVFVILTTDNGETRGELNIDGFNRFVSDFVARAGTAHVIILKGTSSGPRTDLALNLSENSGGMREVINVATAVPERMRSVASRLAADHKAMEGAYELEFVSEGRPSPTLEIRLVRESGAALQFSGRRPF
jgi:VWA domain-containing protein